MHFFLYSNIKANLIADVPPAMSLSMEPSEKDSMDRPPRNPKIGMLNIITTNFIIFNGIVMTLSAFTIYYTTLPETFPSSTYTALQSQSITFTGLTCMHLCQAFYARSVSNSIFVTGVMDNPVMVGSVAFSFSLLVMGVYVPGMFISLFL